MKRMKRAVIARGALAFFLILVGISYLVENFGGQQELVDQALKLWPILPIALGLDLLLISTKSRSSDGAERIEGPGTMVIIAVIFISILGLTIFPLLRSSFGEGSPGGMFRDWIMRDWLSADFVTVGRDIEKTFESVGDLKVLKVESDLGNITVRPNSTLDDEVKVFAEIKARGRNKEEAVDYASSVDVIADIDGGEISLSILKPENTRVHRRPFATTNLVIEVPRDIGLVLKNSFGNINVEDIAGDLDIENSSGNIKLDSIEGNVRIGLKFGKLEADNIAGDLKFDVSSGPVSIERVTGDVNGKTAFGSVDVGQINGNAKISVESGGLRIGIIEGNAELDCRFGRIRVEDALGSVKASNNAGDIEILSSEVRGAFDINNSMGSIRVYIPKGSAITLDASARMGRIESDLPVSVSESPGRNELRGDINGGGHLFRLRAEAGSIAIRGR